VPNAEALPTRTVPELTVAPPVNVFVPDNVREPLPLIVSDPPVPLITPEYDVAADPPRVNVFD
jgi:hypothetical protein